MSRHLKLAAPAALIAIVVALAGCQMGPTVSGGFDRTLDVSGPIRLELANVSGDVSISGSADAKIHVHGDVRVSGMGIANSQKRLDDLIARPPVELKGDTLRVGKEMSHLHNVSISYTVEVPKETEVSASSVSGSISVRSVRGPVQAESVSGSVRAQDIAGAVKLSSVSGSIEAEKCGDDVHASSVSGNVTVTNAKGDVVAHSVSGDVRASNPGGRVDANERLSRRTLRKWGCYRSFQLRQRHGAGQSKRKQLLGFEDGLWNRGDRRAFRCEVSLFRKRHLRPNQRADSHRDRGTRQALAAGPRRRGRRPRGSSYGVRLDRSPGRAISWCPAIFLQTD